VTYLNSPHRPVLRRVCATGLNKRIKRK